MPASRHGIVASTSLVLFFTATSCGGDAGANGKNTLIATEDVAPGPECATGGKKIASGLDANGNGSLDPIEVSTTTHVCNGQDGIGQTGAPGAAGSTGRTGDAGPSGEAGVQSLVRQVPIPAGTREDCVGGGVEVLSGRDLDRSGTLEDAEVEQRTLVCAPSPCERIRFSRDVQKACVTTQTPWLTLDDAPRARMDVTDSGFLFVALPEVMYRFNRAGVGGWFYSVANTYEIGDVDTLGDMVFTLHASAGSVILSARSDNGSTFVQSSSESSDGVPYRALSAMAQNDRFFGAASPSTAPIRRFVGAVPSATLMANRPAHKLKYDVVTGRLYLLDGVDATIRFMTVPAPSVSTLGTLPVAAGSVADDLTVDEDGRIYVSCSSGATSCPEGSVFRLDPITGASEVLLDGSITVKAIAYHAPSKLLYVARQAPTQLAIERVSILK
jgi:hypothetical protein